MHIIYQQILTAARGFVTCNEGKFGSERTVVNLPVADIDQHVNSP